MIWLILKVIQKKREKKTGKDQKRGKATLISLIGYSNAVKYCDKIIFDVNNSLFKYGPNSKNIKETLNYILDRDKWHKIINF